MQRIFLLKGKVQHYNWGGYHFIPDLLSTSNKEQKPFAEYWMGTHPSQPSTVVIDKETVPLPDLINQYGAIALGERTFQKFGELPYLFKVLDVRQMLSIQVHPSKEEAAVGFEKEEKRGISLTAAHRNYKDRNHKPEMMVALSDFWLLHGFKGETNLRDLLSTVKEIHFLADIFNKEGFQGVFAYVMQLDQQEVNEHLELLARRILPLYDQNVLDKSSEDFWAARAIKTFCTGENYDRGIFCIYLFNLVHLKKGQGVFQPAGMPHAYLEGQNVELMANSDNVLRAGLTDKHIDVSELLKHTICEPTFPKILAETNNETRYPSGADEFILHHYNLTSGAVAFRTESAEIILVIEGNAQLSTQGESVFLKKGESAFLFDDTDIKMESEAGAVIFRAAVGGV